MNWKITIPNYPVHFRTGSPFCMIAPQKRGELEQFNPQILPIEADAATQAAYTRFKYKRKLNYFANERVRQRSKEGAMRRKTIYDHDYFHGRLVQGVEKEDGHQMRLNLKPFRDEPS